VGGVAAGVVAGVAAGAGAGAGVGCGVGAGVATGGGAGGGFGFRRGVGFGFACGATFTRGVVACFFGEVRSTRGAVGRGALASDECPVENRPARTATRFGAVGWCAVALTGGRAVLREGV
jgi:hypothetical protein